MTADPDDSRALDYGVLAALGVLVLLLAGAAIAGLLYVADRFEANEEADEASSGPRPGGGAPVRTGSQANPTGSQANASGSQANASALTAMQARYRPGPFVQVVGLLPRGIRSLRRMAAANRGGHTVDTPWIVAGAELHAGSAPPGGEAGGPTLRLGSRENTSLPMTVIAGSPADLQIVAGPGAGPQGAVQGLIVRFPGYPGYFYLPAVVDSELGPIRVAGVDEADLHFGIDAPVYPNGTPVDPGKELVATIEVAAVDLAGRVSAFARRQLRVHPVGTGDLEVTLSMSEATDLDLYVVDPTGVVVYYGNTTAFSGGRLDLDANAGCGSNMGVNTEHIFWPPGRAPAGTYQVRVANFRSCIQNRPVDYRITVRNCGETAVFSGSFAGPADSRTCDVDPGGQRQWCQQVVTFEVTPCAPSSP